MKNVRLRRYVVITLVGSVHGLILLLLSTAHAPRELTEEVDVPISMALYFPPPKERPVPPPQRRRPSKGAIAPTLPAPTPSGSTVPVTPEESAPASIDWVAEQHTVAKAYADKLGAAAAGTLAASSGTAGSAASPHHTGESYTLSTGEKIVWTSNSCYLISDPPDLATPNTFAHFALARIGCTRGSGISPGELFKQSPAFQKHHPDN